MGLAENLLSNALAYFDRALAIDTENTVAKHFREEVLLNCHLARICAHYFTIIRPQDELKTLGRMSCKIVEVRRVMMIWK